VSVSKDATGKGPFSFEPDVIRIIERAEWFDFGTLDDDKGAVSAISGDAQPFLNEGLVHLPFPETIFRARVFLRIKEPDSLETFGSEFVQILHQPSLDAPIEIMSMMIFGWDYDRSMMMAHGMLNKDEFSINLKVSSNSDACKAEVNMFLAMWMMLNAVNILKEVKEPDAKLNRARIKNRKPPLSRITYVRGNTFMHAMRNTLDAVPSGRASPKMHVRRAHLRHLSDDHIIPIHSMIINGPVGEKRTKYKVMHP
jgi:hypothetical protein